MRYSEPSRACVMLDAMHASNDCAPFFFASCLDTHVCLRADRGAIDEQPPLRALEQGVAARRKNLLHRRVIGDHGDDDSASSVTRASWVQASAPISAASFCADSARTSKTAVTG